MKKHNFIFAGAMAAILLSAGAATAAPTVTLKVTSQKYVDDAITAVDTSYKTADTDLKNEITTAYEAADKALQDSKVAITDFDSFKETNTQNIATAKSEATADAKTYADTTFQTKANLTQTVDLAGAASADKYTSEAAVASAILEINETTGNAGTAIAELQGKVKTLEGDNTTNKANIAAAAEKIGTGTLPAEEGFEDLTAAVNTLVASDQEFATGFNERIQETDDAVDANAAAITALQSADTALGKRVSANETNITNITKADGLIATAKSEAISAAAEDATTKADAAKDAAIADTDTKLQAYTKSADMKFEALTDVDGYKTCIANAPICVWGYDSDTKGFAWIAVTPDNGTQIEKEPVQL